MNTQWLDIINQQHEQRMKDEQSRYELFRDALPAAIERLPKLSIDDLFSQLEAFSGSRASVREMVLNETYTDAIKAEMRKRMVVLTVYDWYIEPIAWGSKGFYARTLEVADKYLDDDRYKVTPVYTTVKED